VPIYETVALREVLRIKSNNHHSELIKSWGRESITIADVPILADEIRPNPDRDKPYTVVLGSLPFGEPAAEILEAATHVPETDFCMAGNFDKLSGSRLKMEATNVCLAGNLPYAECRSIA
jgi:hypothetical protein